MSQRPCKNQALRYGKVMFSTYVDARLLKRVATKTIFRCHFFSLVVAILTRLVIFPVR